MSNISQVVRSANSSISLTEAALSYHGRAIKLVQRKLTDPVSCIDDGTIGTILAFAMFSVRMAVTQMMADTHGSLALTGRSGEL